jgi:hypothetical protein
MPSNVESCIIISGKIKKISVKSEGKQSNGAEYFLKIYQIHSQEIPYIL